MYSLYNFLKYRDAHNCPFYFLFALDSTIEEIHKKEDGDQVFNSLSNLIKETDKSNVSLIVGILCMLFDENVTTEYNPNFNYFVLNYQNPSGHCFCVTIHCSGSSFSNDEMLLNELFVIICKKLKVFKNNKRWFLERIICFENEEYSYEIESRPTDEDDEEYDFSEEITNTIGYYYYAWIINDDYVLNGYTSFDSWGGGSEELPDFFLTFK